MEFISTRYLNHRLITRNASTHKSKVLWNFKIKSTRFACEVPIRLPGNNKSTHGRTYSSKMKQLWLLALLVLLPAARSVELQCNGIASSRQKRIVIRSPTARQLSELDSCQYEVAPWSTQVCQVRIDIERLELPQPRLNASSNGGVGELQCMDFLQVQRFRLCGRNNGQHLYVTLQQGQTLKLHFSLTSHWAQATWQLTLTQLECPSNMLPMASVQQQQQPLLSSASNALQLPTVRPMLPFLSNLLAPRTIFGGNSGNGPAAQLLQTLRAPSPADMELLAPLGCDQYYRSSSGGIASFNFAGGIYMPNMRYTMCVAGAANSEIRWAALCMNFVYTYI